MQILTFRKGFETFECKFESFEKNSKIWMQIRTIRKGIEAFQCKFEQFETDSKHSNANSDHSNQILSFQMQI